MKWQRQKHKKRARKKYEAKTKVQVLLKLNRNTDKDILTKLERVTNKQGYIKELSERTSIKGGPLFFIKRRSGAPIIRYFLIFLKNFKKSLQKIICYMSYKITTRKNLKRKGVETPSTRRKRHCLNYLGISI